MTYYQSFIFKRIFVTNITKITVNSMMQGQLQEEDTPFTMVALIQIIIKKQLCKNTLLIKNYISLSISVNILFRSTFTILLIRVNVQITVLDNTGRIDVGKRTVSMYVRTPMSWLYDVHVKSMCTVQVFQLSPGYSKVSPACVAVPHIVTRPLLSLSQVYCVL